MDRSPPKFGRKHPRFGRNHVICLSSTPRFLSNRPKLGRNQLGQRGATLSLTTPKLANKMRSWTMPQCFWSNKAHRVGRDRTIFGRIASRFGRTRRVMASKSKSQAWSTPLLEHTPAAGRNDPDRNESAIGTMRQRRTVCVYGYACRLPRHAATPFMRVVGQGHPACFGTALVRWRGAVRRRPYRVRRASSCDGGRSFAHLEMFRGLRAGW